MIPNVIFLALCGAAGALTYSFPLYLKAVAEVPPAKFALHHMISSVIVGSVFAAIFTRVIGHNFAWTVNPEPWPLAYVLGLTSNKLVPVILTKVLGWADKYTPGGK